MFQITCCASLAKIIIYNGFRLHIRISIQKPYVIQYQMNWWLWTLLWLFLFSHSIILTRITFIWQDLVNKIISSLSHILCWYIYYTYVSILSVPCVYKSTMIWYNNSVLFIYTHCSSFLFSSRFGLAWYV